MKKFPLHDIEAYILAGGKSTRMGTDKGLLDFRGKPMIMNALEASSHVFEKVRIVSQNMAYAQFQRPLVCDMIADIGPAGGIYTALIHTEKKYIFVLPCDCPNIDHKSIWYILNHFIDSFDMAIACNGSKMQPLFGIYKKSFSKKLLSMIQNHTLAMHQIIDKSNCQYIEIPNFDHVFKNINTPADYEELLSKNI